jgi:hypothetical protein
MSHSAQNGPGLVDKVKRTGKVTKRLRPDKSNRQEALALIVWGLADADAMFKQNIALRGENAKYLETKNVSASSISSAMDCFFSFGHGCNELLKGHTAGWILVKEAFCVAAYAQALGQRLAVDEGIDYSQVSAADGGGLIQFYSLALAGNANGLADWVGRFLYNYISEGGMEAALADHELMMFYWELLKAHFKREWPKATDLDGELGPFFDVLATANQPDEFQAALIAYCDFRLSRTYGFENVDSQRARSGGGGQYQFQSQWFAIWPLELLAMQTVYRNCTGRNLSLDADHPLLKTPLMSVPSMLPLAESDYSKRLNKLGEEVYGGDWKPFTPLALVRQEYGDSP